jgi:nitrate reductase beta subunit
MPDVAPLRIPLRYLANLLTAGDEAPVAARWSGMLGDARLYARQADRWRASRTPIAEQSGSSWRDDRGACTSIMAIANYEDRFVIPTTHREYAEDAYELRGGCGFSVRQRLLPAAQTDQPVRHPHRVATGEESDGGDRDAGP